jgi:hypothetical protein
LTLTGIKALHVENFREGNIVSEVEMFSVAAPISKAVKLIMDRLFPAPHPSADQVYHDRYAIFIEDRISEISSGAAKLVSISSSYGADLLAFCETVEARPTA